MTDTPETTAPPASSSSPSFGLGSILTHSMFGTGKVIDYEGQSYVMVFKGGESKRVAFAFQGLQAVKEQGDPQLDRLKSAVREVLGEHGWLDAELEMGRRWQGGTMLLKPGQEGTQSKEIPLEALFKKLIGVREKLRVLEQKINNHPALSSEDKIELEGYITRCYGSLTTFNVLFTDKEGQFHGTGKSTDDAD